MARKILIGKVVSNKMATTVIVEIARSVMHPVYKKIMKKTKRLKVDSNGLEIPPGATVKIEQTRPLSKDKHFKVVKILKQEGGK